MPFRLPYSTCKVTLGTGGGIVLPDGTLVSGIANFRITALYDANGNPKLTVDGNGRLTFTGEATFQEGIKANSGIEFAPGVGLDENSAGFLKSTLQNLGYREGGALDHSLSLPTAFIHGIAGDAAGNVYIGGSFWGSLTLGSITLTTGHIFVAKITREGVVQWPRASAVPQ